MSVRMFAVAAAAALLLAAPAHAAEVRAGDLTLSGLAVRASLGANPNTAAYLTVTNAGAKPDRLLSVSCACAAKVELHESMVHDGMAMMMASGPVTIPAGGSTVFKPGGRHLMVMGLKAPLKDGTTQTFVLRFERAGAVKADFPVNARID